MKTIHKENIQCDETIKNQTDLECYYPKKRINDLKDEIIKHAEELRFALGFESIKLIIDSIYYCMEEELSSASQCGENAGYLTEEVRQTISGKLYNNTLLAKILLDILENAEKLAELNRRK